MAAILTVLRSDGELFFHSKGKLWSCWSNPNWREQATRFKTAEHAARLARKKYRLDGIVYKGWTATTIDDRYISWGTKQ